MTLNERPTSRPSASLAGHIGFLDGIRGLAALWVVIGHCMIWGGWFWPRFPIPLIAVDVFMFVSGYLMTHQWTRRHGEGSGLTTAGVGEFLVRRFFRIAPVYYFMLAVTFLFAEPLRAAAISVFSAIGGKPGGAFDPALFDFGITNLLLRLTFVFGFMPERITSLPSIDWSLALEMQFYLAFPFLLAALRRRGAVTLIILSVAASLATSEGLRRVPPWFGVVLPAFPLPTLLPWKLTVFLAGMLVAEASRHFKLEPRYGGFLAVLAVLAGALSEWQVAAVAALSFCLVSGTAFGPRLGGRSVVARADRFLNNRVMSFLADTSYAVYLVHGKLISLIGAWLLNLPWLEARPGPVRVGLLFLLVAGAAYPVGWVMHHLVERPGIELGRKVAARWFGKPSAGLRPAGDRC